MTARAAAALVAALLLALPAAARAADAVPTAAEIRANVRAAEHEPNAYRETIVTTSSDGTTTTERHLVRGDDERTIDDSPPFHAESGVVHGAHWLQDENGVTLDDREDPGRAKPETLTTTVTRVRRPVDAYAIATLNPKGWGRKDYVDPVSWHVVRRERILGSGTVTTTYDDVRDDGGRVFAHRWHIDNTVAQTTSDSRVTEFVPGGVDDAELARPPSRRALVAFADGVASADLPADFAEHVYVAVRIGETTVDFVLDTGSSGIVVDATVARLIGLQLYGEHSHVVAGRATYARAIVPELHAGALTMRDVVVGVVPLGWTGKRGGRIGGLLGFDFLAQLGVTIDYEHHRVTAVPGSAFVAPAGPQTVALACALRARHPARHGIVRRRGRRTRRARHRRQRLVPDVRLLHAPQPQRAARRRRRAVLGRPRRRSASAARSPPNRRSCTRSSWARCDVPSVLGYRVTSETQLHARRWTA